MYIKHNNGKIMICAEEAIQPGMVKIEPPDGFNPEEMHMWEYHDGVLTKCVGADYAPPIPTPTVGDRIEALEAALLELGALLGGV